MPGASTPRRKEEWGNLRVGSKAAELQTGRAAREGMKKNHFSGGEKASRQQEIVLTDYSIKYQCRDSGDTLQLKSVMNEGKKHYGAGLDQSTMAPDFPGP